MEIEIKQGEEPSLLRLTETELKQADEDILQVLLESNVPLGQWTEIAVGVRVRVDGDERSVKF